MGYIRNDGLVADTETTKIGYLNMLKMKFTGTWSNELQWLEKYERVPGE